MPQESYSLDQHAAQRSFTRNSSRSGTAISDQPSGAEGTTGTDVDGEVQSGCSGKRGIRGCDPQTGRVAPEDSRYNV